ncbi:hypothetical protein F5X68DRAFT_247741 [Plectosphaerella plurivora]|uniref:T6SS Phospholipase effector Tle1-like catalytic domain-containing protein n=1 Tax=Plectosphaerella plurivora TaxID=936078 RepID=A0A9P8VH20_9PEZI|nr:hypothetical protein F5X68DRAFT_247741 [Plectosphaerella plurivora]
MSPSSDSKPPEYYAANNMEQPPVADNMATYKRIIVCIDGTWLSSDQGTKNSPTNVALLARSISSFGIDDKGKTVTQIVSYHSGLASGDLPLQKAIWGGLGWGLDQDICEVYEFIADNYSPGDELFFFGFSRGAFTARSAAGLVTDIGILNSTNMHKFPAMYEAYRNNTGGDPFSSTPWFINHAEAYGLVPNVKIKVVGVWETVGALGVPEWPLTTTLQNLGFPLNKQYAFHNTNVSPWVDYAFQALALDEQRLTFPPTMWRSTTGAPAKSLVQCWFPGVHGNLGGQADDPVSAGDHGEIGNITFAWMIDNLSGLLTFEATAIEALIHTHKKALEISPVANGWGCGPIVSNFAGLQGKFFYLLGKQDRTPGRYQLIPGNGFDGPTFESFHPTVRVRRDKVKEWQPGSLKGWNLKRPQSSGKGWSWTRNAQVLPEFQMSRKPIDVACEGIHGGGCRFEQMPSLSRTLCPKDVLAYLDNTCSDSEKHH